MKPLRRTAYILSTCLLSISALPQMKGTLLVANQKDRSLSLINLETANQVAVPEERVTGHEVAASLMAAPLTSPSMGTLALVIQEPMVRRCSSLTFHRTK